MFSAIEISFSISFLHASASDRGDYEVSLPSASDSSPILPSEIEITSEISLR